MHSMGLHSALAIKRQRKRRAEMKRAKSRRYSIQSTESGLGGSHSSFASRRNSMDEMELEMLRKRTIKSKAASFESNVGIGMLQIGVVFLVLGVFLLGSILIPDDFSNWSWKNIFTKNAWWNELVITGVFALLLGVFLIVLNRFISKKEEEDLNEYVQKQLTRSRSGHRLVRDVETGNLVPKRSKTLPAIDDGSTQEFDALPAVHSPKLKSPPPSANGETAMLSPQLEKIVEEDVSPMADRTKTCPPDTMDEEYESPSIGVQETQVTPEATFDPAPAKYQQIRRSKI